MNQCDCLACATEEGCEKSRVRRFNQWKQRQLLPLHDSCVLCENEGQHEAGRPHVMFGQE